MICLVIFQVEAIQSVEEERQTILASRTNPLDNELIKTKGLLRAPSLRDKKGDRWRKDIKEISEKIMQGDDEIVIGTSVEKEDGNSSGVNNSVPGKKDKEAAAMNGVSVDSEKEEKINSKRKSLVACESCLGKDEGNEMNSGDASMNSTSDSSSAENGQIDSYVTVTLPKRKLDCLNCSDNASNNISKSPFDQKTKDIKTNRNTEKISDRGDPPIQASSEVDSDVIKNLLKDIENVKKKETVPSLINESS